MPSDDQLHEVLEATRQRLEAETRQRLEAESMLDALAALTEREDLGDGRGLIDALQPLFGHERGTLYRAATDDTLHPVGGGVPWPPGGLLTRVLRGQPVAVFDVSRVPDWSERPSAEREGVRSALHVPLRTARARHVLVLTHSASGAFPSHQLRSAKRFMALAERVLTTSEDRQEARARALAEARAAELEEQLTTIRQQRSQILELIAPVLPVWDGILVVPLVGDLSPHHMNVVTDRLLHALREHDARWVILDITGVGHLDTTTTHLLTLTIRAAQLSGGRCLLTGVRPETALALTQLGVDLSQFETRATLQAGLHRALTR